MTNMEKIKEAESMMLKATKLMESAKKLIEESKISNDTGVLAEYNNKFGTGCSYWYLDGMGDIIESSSDYKYYEISPKEYNYFNGFWDLKYAEQSKQLTAFNNKLLAFKWCYDRDYEPDWDSNEAKFFVYRSYLQKENMYNTYRWDTTWTLCENIIYFSSEEIAQKCCDWLNSMEKK